MFGNNLKKLRKACGFKQDDVARVLGIDRSAYSYYEGEKTQPNIINLIKIARMYKVDVDTLVGNSEYSKSILSGQLMQEPEQDEPVLDAELNKDLNLDTLNKLSHEERVLVAQFRQAADKKAVLEAVAAMCNDEEE